MYHSNIISLSQKFQTEFPSSLENFYELQSVFSSLENNLYMIYCIFWKKRDSSFYFIIYFYLCLFLLFQLCFLILISMIHVA